MNIQLLEDAQKELIRNIENNTNSDYLLLNQCPTFSSRHDTADELIESEAATDTCIIDFIREEKAKRQIAALIDQLKQILRDLQAGVKKDYAHFQEVIDLEDPEWNTGEAAIKSNLIIVVCENPAMESIPRNLEEKYPEMLWYLAKYDLIHCLVGYNDFIRTLRFNVANRKPFIHSLYLFDV
jgi:hypothetical protein